MSNGINNITELPVSDEVLLEGFVLYCKLLIHINGTASQEKVHNNINKHHKQSSFNVIIRTQRH